MGARSSLEARPLLRPRRGAARLLRPGARRSGPCSRLLGRRARPCAARSCPGPRAFAFASTQVGDRLAPSSALDLESRADADRPLITDVVPSFAEQTDAPTSPRHM